MSSRKNIYSIPENFITEGKVINGLFDTRGFIEGAVLAVIGIGIAFLIPNLPGKYRISEVIAFAAPLFLLGLKGINGDPVSVFLINFFKYHSNKTIMLYDIKPRALTESPVKRMEEEKTLQERLYSWLDERNEKRLEKIINQEYYLGENFVFAPDTDAMRDYREELSEEVFEAPAHEEKHPAAKRKKRTLSSEDYYKIAFSFDEDDVTEPQPDAAENTAEISSESADTASIPLLEPDEDIDFEPGGGQAIPTIKLD